MSFCVSNTDFCPYQFVLQKFQGNDANKMYNKSIQAIYCMLDTCFAWIQHEIHTESNTEDRSDGAIWK